MPLDIVIRHGSILDADVDVIVNAANSRGLMGGGVAGAIKRAAGETVEEEASAHAPISVGGAVITSAGRTGFKGIVHAPTMPEPGMRIPAANVAKATRAALALADQRGITSIALPGMGTGIGGVDPTDAAEAMIAEIRTFKPATLRRVVLTDVSETMIAAWHKAVSDQQSAQ